MKEGEKVERSEGRNLLGGVKEGISEERSKGVKEGRKDLYWEEWRKKGVKEGRKEPSGQLNNTEL